MSIYVRGKADIALSLRAKTGLAITTQDLSFGPPTVATAAEKSKYNRNTRVRVTMVPESTIAAGSEVIYYDRLELDPLKYAKVEAAALLEGATFNDVMAVIKKNIGAVLTSEDVTMSAVSIDSNTGIRTFTLTAKDTSHGYVGQVTLTFPKPKPDLADEIADANLQGLNYPTDNTTDTYGSMYLTALDFTPYALDIKALPTGVLSSTAADALVTTLKAVDVSAGKTLWNNTTGATAWSVQGAEVISNGLNNDSSVTVRSSFKYVMVLKLRSDVPKPKGSLILHYNEPFNPAA